MNLLLLDAVADEVTLAANDPRAEHLRRVLRAPVGQVIDVGVPRGPRGRAEVVALDDRGVTLRCRFLADDLPVPLPVHLLVGLIRPLEGRRLLEDAAAAGVAAIHVFPAARTEAGYATASVWSEAEAGAALRKGAAQGFTTWIPFYGRHADLASALAAVSPDAPRLALDVYEATGPLLPGDAGEGPVVLALGPERGWSAAERAGLRAAGFAFRHLGPRVLRTPHAVTAALGLLAAGGYARTSHLEEIRRLREKG